MVKKMYKPRLPRGIYDIPPDKYEKYLWLFDIFRENCVKYGFRIMEPATIEFFETLALKSGPDISKEIYDFLDKAGRKLGLRFDLTVGLTRYVASNPQLPKPIKLGAYSVQWRYDEPQFGRYRSFYAWDIEIYGGDEIYSAIETIMFINDFLSKTGLKKFYIHISDRRLLEKIIRQYSPNGDILGIMRALDKWGKVPKEEIISLIEQCGGENAEDLVNLVFIEREPLSLIEEYNSEELKQVYYILKERIGLQNILVDPSIVRGLDYYDGIVFEVKVKDVKEVGAIVGGGAYKRLTELMGMDLNAIGAAGGVERLLLALDKQKISIGEEYIPRIIVIPLSDEYISYALKVADDLRKLCKATVLAPVVSKSLKGWLKYVSKSDLDYAVFIGKNEVETHTLTIKDLKRRSEKRIKYDEESITKVFSKRK